MRPHRADILLADNDPVIRRSLAEALREAGGRITEAATGDDLIARIHERASDRSSYDLIISDVRLTGVTELDEDIASLGDDTPIILITGRGDRDVWERARQIGATVFARPFDIEALRDVALALVPSEDELYRDHGGEQ